MGSETIFWRFFNQRRIARRLEETAWNSVRWGACVTLRVTSLAGYSITFWCVLTPGSKRVLPCVLPCMRVTLRVISLAGSLITVWWWHQGLNGCYLACYLPCVCVTFFVCCLRVTSLAGKIDTNVWCWRHVPNGDYVSGHRQKWCMFGDMLNRLFIIL